MENGLFLAGLIVASKIDKGNRRDDGKPWCARTTVISTGTEVFSFRESGLEPSIEHQPHPIHKQITVDCNYARTEGGNTTVGGKIVEEIKAEKK